ncbi:MAG: hypothetical protein IID38_02615 [Planctomycetes bacterium]|nr:hypothetical protein [Planctomycetota bacterium]
MPLGIFSRLVLMVFVIGTTVPATAREPNRVAPKDLRPRETRVHPVFATVGFETGIVTLVSIVGNPGSSEPPSIDWGDSTDPTLAFVADCSSRECSVKIVGTHVYQETGVYTITIQFPSEETETTTATVSTASDFVILSIGDSVASGEGNPVVTWLKGGPAWDDSGSCHRSSLAGPALAARQVMDTNENVTFVHQACSGDDIANVIERFKVARSKLPRIDILLITAGANEIAGGFSNLICECIEFPVCVTAALENGDDLTLRSECARDPEFKNRIATSVAGLTDKYADLALTIQCQKLDPITGEIIEDPVCADNDLPIPSVVIMAEYFDPTHDRRGRFPGPLTVTSCELYQINTEEWEFMYDNVVIPLNEQVAAAAALHGWVLVDGIADAFLKHGYCASAGLGPGLLGKSWVVKLPQSFRMQGDQNGTAHPNRKGQEVYRDRIFEAIVESNPPVTTVSGTAAGLRYTFGSPTPQSVELRLTASNFVRESGVGRIYFAVDEPSCDADPSALDRCSLYLGPFTIDTPGLHTVTFFSENASGDGLERAKTVEVFIDK